MAKNTKIVRAAGKANAKQAKMEVSNPLKYNNSGTGKANKGEIKANKLFMKTLKSDKTGYVAKQVAKAVTKTTKKMKKGSK
jgi:hypothetical protein